MWVLQAALGNIDAERAEAFGADDKRRIDATIKTELGGFDAVSVPVILTCWHPLPYPI